MTSLFNVSFSTLPVLSRRLASHEKLCSDTCSPVTASSNEERFCRVCLQKPQPAKNSFLPLLLVDENDPHTTVQTKRRQTEQMKHCQEVLRLVIPDFDYSTISNPIICMSCHTKLVTAYNFLKEYQTNEELIKQYKERYAPTKDSITIDEVVKSKDQLEKEGLQNIENEDFRKRTREWNFEDDEQQSEIKFESAFEDIEKTSSERDEHYSLLQSSECTLNEDRCEVKVESGDVFQEEMVTVKEEFNCEEFPTTEIFTPSSLEKVKLEDTMDEFYSNTTVYKDIMNLKQYPPKIHVPRSQNHFSDTVSTTNQSIQQNTFDDNS